MQAFRRTDCGAAMLRWHGNPNDAIHRVARVFLIDKDADMDLVRSAKSMFEGVLGAGEPKLAADEITTVQNIIRFLDEYIRNQKKR